ncbi:PIN domain-containing protein [Ekhidna sp.]
MKEDNVFIDTNIFIYSIDDLGEEKKGIASELITEQFLSGKLIVSFQVVQEFLNTCIRKKVPDSETEKYLKSVIFPLWEIYPTRDLYLQAIRTKEHYRYSFYDSLIIAAALEGNCKTLYSEDLQHNQKIESLTIINPFK